MGGLEQQVTCCLTKPSALKSEPPAAHHTLPASQTRPTPCAARRQARGAKEENSANGEIDLKADTRVGGISRLV